MTTNIQKIKEKIIGEQLLHSLGKSWTISFPPNEEEWPDLIVNAGGETFGLEIREFTNDDELRKDSQRRAVESRNIQKLGQLADCAFTIYKSCNICSINSREFSCNLVERHSITSSFGLSNI